MASRSELAVGSQSAIWNPFAAMSSIWFHGYRERGTFPQRLNLCHGRIVGHSDIHIEIRSAIFRIIEAQQNLVVGSSKADCRHLLFNQRRGKGTPDRRSRFMGSAIATKPPVMEAVLVPPSACNASQSIQSVLSPGASCRRPTAAIFLSAFEFPKYGHPLDSALSKRVSKSL